MPSIITMISKYVLYVNRSLKQNLKPNGKLREMNQGNRIARKGMRGSMKQASRRSELGLGLQ